MSVKKTTQFVLAVVTVLVSVAAQADCKNVRGKVTSQLVASFSNGEPCSSGLGLCTEGRFTGNLKGRFTFVADTLTPYQVLDPASPEDVAATTGTLRLKNRLCRGTLVLQDTSAFSLNPADGYFASIATVNGAASSRGCAEASGRIRIQGVFDEGCVDCDYEGVICAARIRGDDDDD